MQDLFTCREQLKVFRFDEIPCHDVRDLDLLSGVPFLWTTAAIAAAGPCLRNDLATPCQCVWVLLLLFHQLSEEGRRQQKVEVVEKHRKYACTLVHQHLQLP